MFLVARLFGILTYTTTMLMSLFFIRYSKHSQTKFYFIIYLCILCVMAYLYVPYETTDVFRHNIIAKFLAEQSWGDFWDIVKNSKRGIFTLFYFRYFADYLSLSTCFFVYGIVFYIIYDSSKILNVPNLSIATTLFWFMTNDFYLMSISNIRSYMAVTFVSYCIYREIFKNKFGLLNIILYFCAIQMHAIGIVLVSFRFIAYLLMKWKMSLGKIIFFPIIITAVILGTVHYMPMLESAIDKFEIYQTENLYSYVWEQVIFMIQLVVQLYILYKSYTYRIFQEKRFVYYKSVVLLGFLVFTITIINIVFMQRWIMFSTILEIPVLLELLKKEKEINRCSIKRFIIISSILTFSFVASRGNLCSLKFWE